MSNDCFIYDSNFQSKVNQMTILRESMDEARQKLITLRGHLGTDEWTGEGQKEACAYTWMIIMYMNKLCGDNTKPCEKMEDTLKSFMNAVDNFEKESETAKELKEIVDGF